MEKSFFVNDCGLLIGLISTPRCINSEDFYKSEIEENLFSIYRNRRFENQQNQQNEYLYNPKGYKTFGNHNLAIISLIDDYSYPNRVFHPAHGNRDDESDFYNYEYQVLTCVNTCQAESDRDNGNHVQNVLKTANNLEENPIICITRIKINNFLLIGNGVSCIELIKRTLYKLNKEEFSEIGLFVLDNLGSEELVVIMFSRNFSSIAKFTHKMRHLTVKNLKETDDENCSTILENRLKIETMDESIDWVNAHIFSSSYSLPGYNIYSNQGNNVFTPEDDRTSIIIDFTWDIKPGHANNFENEFRKILEKNGFKEEQFIIEEPLRLNNSSWKFSLDYSLLLKKRTPSELFQIIENLRNFDIDQHHTRKLYMKMVVKDTNREILNSTKEIVTDRHPKSFSYCEKIKFNGHELSDLRYYLERSKVSKLLKEKIMKMYNNYNSCIIDPMYFSNFVDLYGFLKSFIKQIKDFAENVNAESSFKFHEWLNQYVTSFEQAYYNRFHQSNRTRNMTDYNIEWNGGIQQMISPIDFIYKQILFHLGLKQYDKFVHVSGFERVHVTQHTFRINMLHITYPELFVSTIWKEVFNFFWRDRSKKDSTLDFFKSPKFVSHLKYSIERHRNFDKSNEVHQFLYDSIDNQFVNGLIADTLSYYYGYNEDYDSFSYWYWRVLLQSSMYYDKSGKLNTEIFTLFLGRTLFIRGLEDNDNTEIEKLRFMPTDATLSELWVNNFESTRSFIKVLREILEWSDFRKLFKAFAIKLMEKDVQHNIPKNDDQYWSKIYDLRKRAFNIERDNLLKDFQNGKIMYPTEVTDSNLFIPTLFASFLAYIKQIDGDSNKKTRVLLRDENGKPIVQEFKDCYSNILSDPLGGIFCIDKDIQTQCFNARTLYYRSIFDYCMINKKTQINYFINSSN